MSKFREIFWRDKEPPELHVWYLRADLDRPMERGPRGAYDGWQLRLYPYSDILWEVSFARGYALKGSDGWGYTGGLRSHPNHMSTVWTQRIGRPIVPSDKALREMGLSEYMELQGILKKINKRWPDLGVVGARSNPTGEPKEKFYLVGSNLRPFEGAVLEWIWSDGQRWDMTIDPESRHVYVAAGDESGAFRLIGIASALGTPVGRPPLSLGMAASMMWTRITELSRETLAEKARRRGR